MSPDSSEVDAAVNPHYLDHVVSTSERHAVEASEDIIAANGMKLLAKGARVEADVRERLLQHKLNKPLEQCLVVADALTPAQLARIAEELLQRHPFIEALCASERAQPVVASLERLPLSGELQSLLTVYAGSGDDRTRHAVAVALIALGLGRKLLAGDIDGQRTLLVAGLMHDVGELYIDPAMLAKGARVDTGQWKHIVTHPLVGHRVLGRIAGAGRGVADAVLQHHERLDGFGYPHGLREDALGLPGQLLAAAEWLAGLLGSGQAPLTRASVASKLLPGEFHEQVIAALSKVVAGAPRDAAPPAGASPEDLARRMGRICGTMRRFAEARPWIDERTAQAGAPMARLLASSVQRMERLQRAFASTGLAGGEPAWLLEQLSAEDEALLVEIRTIVREVEWRLRQLERDSLLRAGLMSAADREVMQVLVGRLTGKGAEGARDAVAAGGG